MPQYKLIYFNIKGRAECARMIFAQAGVEYEDYRLKEGEWPGTLKEQTPMGQLPVLEVDGKMLCQSMAIARYLAKQFDLTGSNDWDSAQCDMLADGLNDVFAKFVPWFMEKDEEKKKELLETLKNEHIKPCLDRYSKFLADNGNGYMVGQKLTWADLLVFGTMDWWKAMFGELVENYPKILDHSKMVSELPNIKKWLETRPQTPM